MGLSLRHRGSPHPALGDPEAARVRGSREHQDEQCTAKPGHAATAAERAAHSANATDPLCRSVLGGSLPFTQNADANSRCGGPKDYSRGSGGALVGHGRRHHVSRRGICAATITI